MAAPGWRRRARALAVAAAAATGQCSAQVGDWSYGGQPFWGNMYGSRCAGSPQSPIDINTSRLITGGSAELLSFAHGHKLGPLVWSFHNATLRAEASLAHGTWLLRIEAPYDSTTTTVYFGYEFELKSLSLHSPSENTVNGQHYDLEVQLLHDPVDGQGVTQHLVTSVMLRVGADGGSENGFLQSVRQGFSEGGGSAATAAGVYVGNPYRFLYPRDRSYYSFNGSLTAPPCSPATWVVFATPTEISAQQLQYFRRSMDAVRPNRLHYSASEPAPAGVTCPSSCPGLDYVWNKSLGMNVRDLQPMGSRWVKHVQMLDPESAGPASWGGSGWWWWCAAGLAVMLLAAVTVHCARMDAEEFRGADRQRDDDGEAKDHELLGADPQAPLQQPFQGRAAYQDRARSPYLHH